MTRLSLAEKKSKAVIQFMIDSKIIDRTPKIGMPGCVYYGRPADVAAKMHDTAIPSCRRP
jgi:hypothetical protein